MTSDIMFMLWQGVIESGMKRTEGNRDGNLKRDCGNLCERGRYVGRNMDSDDMLPQKGESKEPGNRSMVCIGVCARACDDTA